MIYIFITSLLIPIIILINTFVKKRGLLLSYLGEKHQKFTTNNKIPLTGGIFIFLFSIIFYYKFNSVFLYYLLSFLILGVLSDTKFIVSPTLRFLIQLFLVILLVFKFNLYIEDVRIEYLNLLLQNNFLKFFFAVLCFMILINGTNFIDGCNTLVIGYYTIVTIIILHLELFISLNISNQLFLSLIIFFFIIFIFNFFNEFYLGDSGSYLISIISGSILILIYQANSQISPYFIVLLLWYPAFETLFSIVRKSQKKNSPFEPDTNHLHQLIFLFLKYRYKKNKYNNPLSANLINFYNLLSIYLASNNIYDSKFQITIIAVNIIIYLLAYFYFYNFMKTKKN